VIGYRASRRVNQLISAIFASVSPLDDSEICERAAVSHAVTSSELSVPRRASGCSRFMCGDIIDDDQNGRSGERRRAIRQCSEIHIGKNTDSFSSDVG
jgi:hypothetical protein